LRLLEETHLAAILLIHQVYHAELIADCY